MGVIIQSGTVLKGNLSISQMTPPLSVDHYTIRNWYYRVTLTDWSTGQKFKYVEQRDDFEIYYVPDRSLVQAGSQFDEGMDITYNGGEMIFSTAGNYGAWSLREEIPGLRPGCLVDVDMEHYAGNIRNLVVTRRKTGKSFQRPDQYYIDIINNYV